MRGIVQVVSERETKAKDTYFSGNIKTLNGLYNFIWFDPDIEKAKDKLKVGYFLQFEGTLTKYENRDQFQIKDFEVLLLEDMTEDEKKLIPRSPIDIKEMEDYIFNTVIPGTIKSGSVYETLLKHFLLEQQDWYRDFRNYPAAKGYHHAYRHGIMHHIYGMLSILEGVSRSHKDLDIPLLVTGIILHDYGKIWEMEIGPENIAFIADYGMNASFSNHAIMMLEKINKLNLPESPELMKIKHLIAAHHNKLEWGALVEPSIPEADILAHIDLLDAHSQGSLEAIKGLKDGSHTTKYNITGYHMYKIDDSKQNYLEE